MPDRHIRHNQDDYAEALAGLLPTGPAWPRDPDSVLMQAVQGLAGIYDYIDGRAADLLERESDPRATIELLEDWETAWGLPDPCYAEPFTVGDRQTALVQRMTILGGQSREFFIAAALFIGYVITITEYRPFMVGLDRCGDNRTIVLRSRYLGDYSGGFDPTLVYYYYEYSEWPCQIGPPEMRFYWTVHVHSVRLTWFRASKGQAGVDPHLRIALATDLECLLRRWKPAVTEVIFDYSGVTPSDSMAGTP